MSRGLVPAPDKPGEFTWSHDLRNSHFKQKFYKPYLFLHLDPLKNNIVSLMFSLEIEKHQQTFWYKKYINIYLLVQLVGGGRWLKFKLFV